MTVLVLGSSGQVARHLRELWPEALFWGRNTLDISDTANLERAILAASPDAVVNAAAYTAVDRAETEAQASWRLNAEAPAAAARAAEALGIPLVHLSTDYVFDGEADVPYAVGAATRPLSTYGRTKLGGELAVASICSRHWILRTSWVFSETGANFVHTMLRLAHSRDTLQVVDDQIGRPTYAGDLALLIARVVPEANTRLPYGVYHAVGGPVVSWHAFAAKIFDRARALGLLSRIPEVLRIKTHEYPVAATRPLRAVLEPSAELEHLGGWASNWESGLERTLRRILARQHITTSG